MNQRGMTLAELLVAMFVLTLLGGVVLSAYLSAGQFAGDEQSRIEVDTSANRILTEVDQYLRQGKNVEANHTFSGTPRTTSDSVLVFAIPTLLANGTLAGSNVDYAVFYVDSGVLKFELEPHDDADDAQDSVRPAQNREIADNVRDLYFRYTTVAPTSASAVTTTIRTEKNLFAFPYTQIAISHVTLRNHP